MIKSIQKLGDRLLSKVVPEVTAEADLFFCGCWPDERGRRFQFVKNCISCACYQQGACP